MASSPFSTPVKQRGRRAEASDPVTSPRSTLARVESRRKAKNYEERRGGKRARSISMKESTARKRLCLEPPPSPIKVRVKRVAIERSTAIDVNAMWQQNVQVCFTKLAEVTKGREHEYYGSAARLHTSRLAVVYADLIFAFSALEMMLESSQRPAQSIHDLIDASDRVRLVDDNLWIPQHRVAFDKWMDYLKQMAQVSTITMSDLFINGAVFVFARIQRATINFVMALHAIDLEDISPVSSYM